MCPIAACLAAVAALVGAVFQLCAAGSASRVRLNDVYSDKQSCSKQSNATRARPRASGGSRGSRCDADVACRGWRERVCRERLDERGGERGACAESGHSFARGGCCLNGERHNNARLAQMPSRCRGGGDGCHAHCVSVDPQRRRDGRDERGLWNGAECGDSIRRESHCQRVDEHRRRGRGHGRWRGVHARGAHGRGGDGGDGSGARGGEMEGKEVEAAAVKRAPNAALRASCSTSPPMRRVS